MSKTKIPWTSKVWNPLRGCTRCSPGCRHCYAERFAARFNGPGLPYEGLSEWKQRSTGLEAEWTGEVRLIPEKLDDPYRWTKTHKVFVNSMSDLFHVRVPDDYIAKVFEVMAMTPHFYQVLTKRAQRMQNWFRSDAAARVERFVREHGRDWPLPNVILMVSVENQRYVNERVQFLVRTPAVYRGISAEPLLEPITLTKVNCPKMDEGRLNAAAETAAEFVVTEYCPLCEGPEGQELCANGYYDALLEGIHWVIVGCESGSGARQMRTEWVRDLRNECVSHGVAFFYKQQMDIRSGRIIKMPELDGHQYGEYPA